jgi:NAD+ kinase
MKCGLYCRSNAKYALRLSKEIYSFLKKEEEVLAEKGFAKAAGLEGVSLKQINKEVDVVAVVGGDGTILRALQEIDKPLFAVNTGELGFLTEVEPKYVFEGLKRVLEGKYQIEERIKLKVMLDKKRLQDAANEVTLHSTQTTRILDLEVKVEGELAEKIKGDGLIVATPTGSTGYALSVGAPVVDPGVDAFIIAPIAPFRLSSRPLVVPSSKKIQLQISHPSLKAQLAVDDIQRYDIKRESEVVLAKSERKARFVRFGSSFYQRVRHKLTR